MYKVVDNGLWTNEDLINIYDIEVWGNLSFTNILYQNDKNLKKTEGNLSEQ